jgi:hypothetical protein
VMIDDDCGDSRLLIWGGNQCANIKSEQAGYARGSTSHRPSISVAGRPPVLRTTTPIDALPLTRLIAGHEHLDYAHIQPWLRQFKTYTAMARSRAVGGMRSQAAEPTLRSWRRWRG